MKPTLKNILKVIAIPSILFIAYLSLRALWLIFDLPPEDELLRTLVAFINQYGLIIIFVAALIEGLLLIGNYFPGGAVIFLGVIAAVGNIPKAALVVLIVCISFSIAYTINYALGRFGWYELFIRFGLRSTLESMQQKLSRHVFSAILSCYWLPNLAAICSTAAGIMRVPFGKFLFQSTIGLVAWNIFWGIFVYLTGDALLTLDIVYLSLIFLMWCGLILIKVFILDRKFGDNLGDNV